MLFDTHLHLIYRERLSYPWLADVPALNRDACYPEYHRVAGQMGIGGALHMEVDVAEADLEAESALVAELMGEPGSLLRGAIASCRPESDGFGAFLERQRESSHVCGFRRVLHVVPDELSRSRRFRDNVKRLSGTGLTFDLCVLARQLPLAIELVDHCPDVRFVLDHCGVPDVAARALSPWTEQVRELARRPNVTGKISGVVAYGDGASWTLDDIRPFVERTVEAFGWERVVWGSDSPVCTLGGHLETWVAATHALLDECSAGEKAALTHANAERLWSVASTTAAV